MRKYINKDQHSEAELKEARRAANHKNKKKVQVILLLYKGKRVSQISEYLGISEVTIYKYIDKYNSGGIEELLKVRYNERGRKSKLTIEEILELTCLSADRKR
jgi:transposase